MTELLDYIINDALVLLPALWIIGKILKELLALADKWIPLLLLPFGIAGAMGLMGISIDAAIQGILLTGTAVYGNQLIRQLGKKQ